MNTEVLVMIAGVALSLVFSYVPKVKVWFSDQQPNTKRLVMLSSLAATSLGAFALACMGRLDTVACTADGSWQLLEYFVLAAIANQTAYGFTPTAPLPPEDATTNLSSASHITMEESA